MKKIRIAVAALGTAALLVGCGSDDGGDGGSDGGNGGDETAFADLPADEIVETAKTAMQELSSVHVVGDVTTDGQAVAMDISLSDSGSCTGSVESGDSGVIEVLAVDGSAWFRGDETFWTNAGVPAEQMTLVLDKWVVDTDGDFSEFCTIDDLLDDMFNSDDEATETYSTKGVEELDGQEVVAVEQTDEEEGVSTGYVQADGEHYLVKIEKTEGEDTGSVTFSEFGEEVSVTAPAEDEVVDLNELG